MTTPCSYERGFMRPTSVRLPDEVVSWLRERAKNNRRSFGSELTVIIERVMREEQEMRKREVRD